MLDLTSFTSWLNKCLFLFRGGKKRIALTSNAGLCLSLFFPLWLFDCVLWQFGLVLLVLNERL